ncbi:hypothetical protein GYMLUDRAFT_590960 [Collybiopsis luxurians FD-317 M1]|uniref:Transmembrane protein n=1 Tax=Collybiopsis luxurians FD-317 M1 TaxID=944289 RepID=A0A0D0CY00_9AGAR|nr:hypothetical protein GYMLUDRAFT_590960 [Collybiopsis luxurians FD-317 M1]
MLLLATVHIIIDFVRILQAFVAGQPSSQEGGIAYYADLSNPLHVVKTVFYVTQTILGDGVMIWRFYVVYQKRILYAVPFLIVLAVNAAAGYVVCWSLSEAHPGSNIFHTAASWITTFFVLTMCINALCTILIALRIFLTSSPSKASGQSLLPVFVTIVESGALYASGVLGLLIAFLSGSNGQYPALDICTPLVGIVYCLIVLQIRYHLDRRVRGTTVGSGASAVKFAPMPKRSQPRGPADIITQASTFGTFTAAENEGFDSGKHSMFIDTKNDDVETTELEDFAPRTSSNKVERIL